MTEKKRKIHVVGINSYKFEDLSLKLQNLFQENLEKRILLLTLLLQDT